METSLMFHVVYHQIFDDPISFHIPTPYGILYAVNVLTRIIILVIQVDVPLLHPV